MNAGMKAPFYHTWGTPTANMGQVEKAKEYYQQALANSQETGDRRGEGTTLGNLGNAYGNLGQVEKAIEYYQGALSISQEIGDRRPARRGLPLRQPGARLRRPGAGGKGHRIP